MSSDPQKTDMPGDFPIHRTPTRAKTIEQIAFWIFRILTYAIIAVATLIFGIIAYNGSKTVFKGGLNWEFLSSYPQTLYVFMYGEVPRDTEPGTDLINLRTIIEENFEIKANAINDVVLYSDLFAYNPNNGELRLKAPIPEDAEKFQDVNVSVAYLPDDDAVEEFKSLAPLTIRILPAGADTAMDVRKYELPDLKFRAFVEEQGIPVPRADTYSYSGGGIWPAIVGTFLLVIGAMVIALTFGVLSAIYLSEYSRPGTMLNVIRLSILNLAGVPSIVFGLFGFAAFVLFFGFGRSLLAGWLTLAFMVLPVIIAASEESLKSIPQGFREGSLALGATKWTTIRTNVLPYALPGILTSSILGITRVAGETAPIMFTAAFATRDNLPWEDLENPLDFVFQGVMALPYHIYVVSSKIPTNQYTKEMQYGTSFIFLLLILGIALISVFLRIRMRKRYQW